LRPATLFLDTNILLDCPQPRDYRVSGRRITLVIIPEVMQELRGLSRSPGRGQAGPAIQAFANLETLARRRGNARGVPVGRSDTRVRVLPGSPKQGSKADLQLVLMAKVEQAKHPGELVAVVTKDWGVVDLARAHGVKSILLRGRATVADLERGIAEHDTVLDIEL
jgi:rRNA-processing protein FCF1